MYSVNSLGGGGGICTVQRGCLFSFKCAPRRA